MNDVDEDIDFDDDESDDDDDNNAGVVYDCAEDENDESIGEDDNAPGNCEGEVLSEQGDGFTDAVVDATDDVCLPKNDDGRIC